MKKLVVGVVSVVALATVGMAAAAATTSPVKSVDASAQTFSNTAAGVYANVGLGYGYISQNKETGMSSVSNNTFAWNALVGYQFTPYVALETSFIDFGHATIQPGDVKEKLYGFGIDAKGIYPVNNKVDVFGTAGVIRMDASGNGDTVHAWTPSLGAGAAYHVMKNVDLTAQDVYAFKNGDKNIPAANALLAGVGYKFNI